MTVKSHNYVITIVFALKCKLQQACRHKSIKRYNYFYLGKKPPNSLGD